MSVYQNKIAIANAESIVSEVATRGGKVKIKSFKKIRIARRKARQKRNIEKALALQVSGEKKALVEKTCPGPTPETQAKLMADPLVVFAKRNILNEAQIWAFQRIRRAIRIITDGTQVRTSHFTDTVVQSNPFEGETESDYEIKIKNHYCNWMDRMTEQRLQAGPILDIIIDEMSLSAVDRKWGKRKGWAKGHLQAALALYGGFSHPVNRYK